MKPGKRSADAISKKQEWKLAKYDPAQMKSVSERMQMVEEDDEASTEPQKS